MNSPRSLLVRSVGTIAALAVILFSSLAAQAAVVTVYSNPFAEVLTTNSLVSGSNQFATGFTTGTDTNFLTLESIDMALATSGTTSSSTPIIRLFSGTSAPSTLVGGFTVSPFSNSTPQSINLPYSAGTVQLSALTTYWIVASATAGDAFGWYTADTNPVAKNSSGYSYLNGLRSTNGGSSFSSSATAGLSQVSVNAQAVPEPSTLVLAGVGLTTAVMIGGVRRKKQAGGGQSLPPNVGRG